MGFVGVGGAEKSLRDGSHRGPTKRLSKGGRFRTLSPFSTQLFIRLNELIKIAQGFFECHLFTDFQLRIFSVKPKRGVWAFESCKLQILKRRSNLVPRAFSSFKMEDRRNPWPRLLKYSKNHGVFCHVTQGEMAFSEVVSNVWRPCLFSAIWNRCSNETKKFHRVYVRKF